METALIWKGRKSAFGATGRVADYICMDGTIPTSQLPFVLQRIDEIVDELRPARRQRLPCRRRQHAPADPLQRQRSRRAGRRRRLRATTSCKLCVEVGGCLTGEHGVGIEKRDLMRSQFTQGDLEQQMRVRAVFDPRWLLNPAKVFPLDGRVAGA